MKQSPSDRSSPNQTRLLMGLSFGNFIGYLGLTLAPMWIPAVAAAPGSSESAAGIVASLQFACFGISSLATAWLIPRFERRHLAIFGLLLAALSDGGSYLSHGIVSIAICRSLSGLGEGFLLAAVNATAAANSNSPQRSFAVMSFVLVGLAALGFIATPFAKEVLGPSGVFGLMAIMRLPGIPLLLLLPRHGTVAIATRRGALSGVALWVLIAYSLFMTGQLSVYSFLEPLGAAQGLSLRAISLVLALGALLTTVGPVVAGWVGTRYGMHWPLIFGLTTTGLSALLFLAPFNVLAFASGDILFNMIAQFCIVYFLSLLAALDRTGRAVAASSAFMSLGITVGPVVGGLSIRSLGLASVSLVAVILHLAAAAVLSANLRRLPRG